jgi:hypothetical protein
MSDKPGEGASESGGSAGQAAGEALERVPFMQRVLDNPFLLLFLGVTVPAVLYLIWGIMEVANIPIAR